VEWNTDFLDAKRKAWHEKKMKSKYERPKKQMERLGLPQGRVWHILAHED
jgi:hypothetical protein